jgi:pyruvate kinase
VKRTKIVCTIGPVSSSASALKALYEAGMSIARLNGSHNTLDWHAETIARIRDTVPTVPILLDIPGRKIRTGQLRHEPEFDAGDRVTLTTDPDHDGTEKVPVGHPSLHEQLSIGTTILADDGTLRFTVAEVTGRDIVCIAETAGKLKSRKGINVPGVKLVSEMITDRDRLMVEFARTHHVDYVGISFVESSAQIGAIRALIEGAHPQIVSKIENQRGLNNMHEIISSTDAIMIDRGDLSAETNFEMMALFQKNILDVAQSRGVPVIIATEMLHTMVENPFPTKAEISDITNSVIDGGSAMMLSGETAVGANPVKAVSVMRAVASAADEHVQDRMDTGQPSRHLTAPQAMERAVAMLCRSLPITKIVAVTISGYAARMIASHRPRQPILAVSNDAAAARSFNLYAGVTGVHVEIDFLRTSSDHVVSCVKALRDRGYLSDSDMIVVISVSYPKSGNRMNYLQTHVVGDLAETLGWDGI